MQRKKKGFEREEKDGILFPLSIAKEKKRFERVEENGFIFIHIVAEKGKKRSWKEKRTWRMKKWVVGNEVMSLLMDVWIFI